MADEVALSLPFNIDPYGNVASTTSQSKIWQDRVLSVIGTTLRERVMRPSFGTLVPYAMFDNEEDAQAEVRNEITQAFNQQLSLLTLDTVVVNFDEYTGQISVSVTYDLPNKKSEQVTTTIGLISIAGKNPSLEELA